MEIIEFPYRGWVLKVVQKPDGWSAYTLDPRCPEFSPLANQFDRASDAVQACMYWVEMATVGSAIREFLDEEKAGDRLTQAESYALAISVIKEAWLKRVPTRTAKEV